VQSKGPKVSVMSDNAANISLFKKQERIYPKHVSGRFRTMKWIAMIVCLGIYYGVPFIRWDRGPNAPDQAVLIDLVHGRAYWFWIEIWPQEVYILTGILIFAAISLFFITSLFGRVWCGYLCFQTVWTDLFVAVERLVQGDRNKRKKLCEGPWTLEKIGKLSLTHIIWIAIAWWTAGSFVLYFTDAPTLVKSFFDLSVSPTVLTIMVALTFSTYLMAGFAREQVCTFMCSYARFQSAMFDKDTLIIGYDENRGEPRGVHKKGADWNGLGDCLDCGACVQVCPMGIDIRNGLQMECIACGLCADACDSVMQKVGLPKGLIAYDTERRIEQRAKGIDEKFRILRPRTLYYACVLTLVGSIMLFALLTRAPVDLNVLHHRNPLFVQLSDGDIRNGYDIKILNKSRDHKNYTLQLDGISDAKISINTAGHVNADNLYVPANKVGKYKIFVHAPKLDQNSKKIRFILTDLDTGYQTYSDTMFISKGPQS
jgi:cytochrome c oxidase accessory protein FixG